MDVLGEKPCLFADKTRGIRMIRITFNAYNPAILNLDQQAAGVRAILGANRSLPHLSFSSIR
jgi:hypothetical protein